MLQLRVKICAACGLTNIPERTTCKQCHATLDAAVIPPLLPAYTGETSTIYFAQGHRAVLLISAHVLEYVASEITIRTTWANVQDLVHTPSDAYLVLSQPAAVRAVRTGIAPLDEWNAQHIPLQPFGYPTNISFATDIRRFVRHPEPASTPILTGNLTWIWLILALPVLLGVLIVCSGGSGLNKSTANLANGLRGNSILIVRIPRKDQIIEDIDVNKKYIATHSLYQPQTPTIYHTSTITLSAALQTSLETLRHDWCTYPPMLPQLAAGADVYQIAMDCGRVANPVFRLLPAQLPPPIDTVVQIAPPVGLSEGKQ